MSSPRKDRPKPREKVKRPARAEPLVYLRRDRQAYARARAAEARDGATEEGPPPERRERRSLSHVGGRVALRGGDADLRAALEAALEVPADDDTDEARAHVHGFHSYAARLHPFTAHRLIEKLSTDGDTVLDPFMGSGTVLVEARLLSRHAIGTDVNPLSSELAHLKTRGTTEDERRALLAASRHVVEFAEERRISKAGPTKRYGKEDLDLFDVHMLLELDGIKAGILLEPGGFVLEALKLVLSSILVKVSRKPGDTVERTSPRRLATGFAIRLFESKCAELATRLEEFASLLPKDAPPCDVAVDDARRLTTVKPHSVDLIVTSPPYPGVYDYASQHEVRLRWLGLDVRAFERTEIGARRTLRAARDRDEGLDRWAEDFTASLRAMRGVLVQNGLAVLVLADSVVQRKALYADDVIARLVEGAGLAVVSSASQRRPHFHEPTRDAFHGRPRREHVFVLAIA